MESFYFRLLAVNTWHILLCGFGLTYLFAFFFFFFFGASPEHPYRTLSSGRQIKGFLSILGVPTHIHHSSRLDSWWFKIWGTRQPADQGLSITLPPLLIILWVFHWIFTEILFHRKKKNNGCIWYTHCSDCIWRSRSDLWDFFPLLFPVPAGRFVLSGHVFSQSRDAAPSLHVSAEWFNFLARAKAVGFSSLHFRNTIYTVIAARTCVLHEKVQWKKKMERPLVVLTYFVKKEKNILDSRCLSNLLLCVHFFQFPSWSPCTLSTLALAISACSEHSHIWILLLVLAIHFHKADFASSHLEVSVWSVLILPLPSDNLAWLTAESWFRNCKDQTG